ncbi:uncharacterized protein LOC116346272 [Contarinia nasturtii]|uniref:uncharacterized protein LOC116346272 n=1 Tax=Contarinia nasturtii TaxID=265458 RepID=UPI0012D4ADE0|nr:uncharacterized protein LOC116346272 [Contarinia nasturtii]
MSTPTNGPTCFIEFENNPEKVVYTGTVAIGTVRLTLPEPITVRSVFIEISGVACAKTTKRRRNYKSDWVYLNYREIFIGGETILTPGTYTYEFVCSFSSDLPTSCEGIIGYKRYTATFTLKMPTNSYDFAEPFTVIRHIDLNTMPHLREPIYKLYEEFSMYKSLLCCVSEYMKFAVHIPVGGYVPGQNINIQINVYKSADHVIHEFTAELFKEINYSMTSTSSILPNKSRFSESFTLGRADVNASEILAEGTVFLNIPVPAVPPTDLHCDAVIKDQYMLCISAISYKTHQIKIPIIIGSYPLRDDPIPSASSFSDSAILSSAPPLFENTALTPSAPSFPENLSDAPNYDPPPTYEEATYLSNTSSNSFKPKYPSFKRKTSYSN